MAKLVLVRHGLSDYNKKGIWTGWDNPPLNKEGIIQAQKTAEQLKDLEIDLAYQAPFDRVRQTLDEILKIIPRGKDISITENAALSERNYGDFTGKNKWEVKEQVGEEEFQRIRRGWDHPIPNGESLKQVYEREIPYYKEEIEPKLKEGKNILVASSGNALRALVKYLENIPDDKISDLEIGTGEAYIYDIDETGNIVNKQIRGENPMKGKV